jgi:hypothetical protein
VAGGSGWVAVVIGSVAWQWMGGSVAWQWMGGSVAWQW